MPQNPDTLPADFFKSKTPDSLPSDFFAKQDAEKNRNLTHYTSQGFPTREMMELNPLPGREDIRQGVRDIRSGNTAKGAHEAFTGAAKASSMFLPSAIVATPGAVVSGMIGSEIGGYGGKKLAEKAGADEDVSDVAGDVGSVLGGAAGVRLSPRATTALKAGVESRFPKIVEMLRSMRDAWEGKPEQIKVRQHEAFKPSANVPKYGGSTDPNYSAPGKQVGMSGSADRFKTPAEIAASKPAPAATAVKEHEPFKPNPTTARAMKYGGSTSTQTGPAGKMVGGKGSADRFRTPQEIAQAKADAAAAESEKASVKKETKPKAEKASTEKATTSPKNTLPSPKQASSVTRADMLADVLRKSGATPELARMVTPEQWKTIAQSAGLAEAPSQATIEAAIDQLGKAKSVKVKRR